MSEQKPSPIALQDAEIWPPLSDAPILRGVSCALSRGDFAWLLGAYGSGKSGLLRTLCAEWPLVAGEAWVLDESLRGLSPESRALLRRRVGVIFPEIGWIESLGLAAQLDWLLASASWLDAPRRAQRVGEVLDLVGLLHLAETPPARWNRVETARAQLARALLQAPEILLIDDWLQPLALPDAEALLHLLYRHQQAEMLTVVFATHRTELLGQFAARAFRCEQGRLAQAD